MIDFYTAGTANGHRAAIALEESGLAYRAHKLNLQAGDQRKPEYLKINPAGAIPRSSTTKVPAASRSRSPNPARSCSTSRRSRENSCEGPRAPRGRAAVAPLRLLGRRGWQRNALQLSMVAPEKSAPNVEFFEKRLVNALRAADARLADREYLADEISVADLALYPVVATRKPVIEKHGGLPNLAKWAERMAARPGVAKGMQVSV